MRRQKKARIVRRRRPPNLRVFRFISSVKLVKLVKLVKISVIGSADEKYGKIGRTSFAFELWRSHGHKIP